MEVIKKPYTYQKTSLKTVKITKLFMYIYKPKYNIFYMHIDRTLILLNFIVIQNYTKDFFSKTIHIDEVNI